MAAKKKPARKKKWMQKAATSMKRRGTVGTFTAAAKRHKMTTAAFANYVLSHKSKFSAAMIKKANFAKNARKAKH